MLADDGDAVAAAAAALLAWYDEERRELPWRGERDPWSIWVSEVMLQQTRVETAIEPYRRFIARFPDVASLAAADESEVLAAWSGLGYYRRARHLHRAARRVVAAGALPRSAEEWRELPGIGEYTAAAIASIAGGEAVAVLDGNVERVLSRLLASGENPRKAEPRRRLRDLASRMLDRARPGDFNQALMELGATICRPARAACDACPLTVWCAGHAAGAPERYPAPRRRPESRRVERQLFVVRRATAVLLVRRPSSAAQLAGFWELPWTEAPSPAASSGQLARRYGGEWRPGRRLGRARHAITDRRFAIEIFAADWQPGEIAEEGSRRFSWVELDAVDEVATSSLVPKALRLAARASGRPAAAPTAGRGRTSR